MFLAYFGDFCLSVAYCDVARYNAPMTNANTHKIGIIQLTSGDSVDENIAQCEAYITQLAGQGAEMVFLPENAFYMRREARKRSSSEAVAQNQRSSSEAVAHDKDAADIDVAGEKNPKCTTVEHPGVLAAQGWAKQHNIWIVIGSIAPRESEDQAQPYNRSVVINAEGEIAAHYDKIHLFDVELEDGESYMESARMAAGSEAKLTPTPFGMFAPTICYDLRFPNLYRQLAQAGAKLFSVPAAFTVPTGKAHWEVLLRARAIETGAFVIAAAQTGEHPGGRLSYGHSLVVNPWGEVLCDLGEEPGCAVVELDMSEVDKMRSTIPAWNYERKWRVGSA